jgi:hypothetical protein
VYKYNYYKFKIKIKIKIKIKMASMFYNISNNRCCSFCGNADHDIRYCDSPSIGHIEYAISQGYHTIVHFGMNDKEYFINWVVNRFLFKDIRVVAVTSGLARASGYNKYQYAEVIYTLYSQASNNILTDGITWSIDRTGLDAFADIASTIETIKKYNITPVITNEQINLEQINCECCICLDNEVNMNNIVKLNCSHQFCCNCVVSAIKKHNNMYKEPSCALCRETIVNIEVNNLDNYNIISQFCNI